MLRTVLLATVVFLHTAAAQADAVARNAAFIAQVQGRWQANPHGPWLARILPPSVTPAQLPEPHSRGAALLVRYCAQCHHLPNPAMHHPAKWPRIVDRMVERMGGKGNMGALMKEMMGEVQAPREEEIRMLKEYLQRHAQRPLERRRYPDLASPAGRSFEQACGQCHGLPDPKSHSAAEWRKVVARMERNMAWMNRVVGSRPDKDEPQLRVEDILAFLQRHARN